ncbi:hypothetical protein ADEAN_000016900 [Angomonas deanei]|uniref:Uncharacterized protein n=1 Tax=Angomonas deanei TaxID=59799 RepID=A0A7G2C215_9TRYP|nr:hypothetical protein ADEAN_000016900 [Angomonas deanei]
MNPNLYDALDSEEEKSIGELARFNAEAEREQQEVYSQFTTRSRLFWDSTAITRRGYGLESSIFVVHVPDALGGVGVVQ